MNEITKTIKWGDKALELSVGKVASQADGAVIVSMGESVVLCTTVAAKEVKEGIGFFPLTVNYREMAYSAGKIPGGFFKREGKTTDRETLVSRLIDRPIRPLFHKDFFNDTQVICTVLSYDKECNPDILSIVGASASLAISGVPYQEIVAASRVGLINGEFVLNPSIEALKNSRLDLVVAGTKSSVMMVESEANMLSEDQMLEAVKFGHAAFQPVIEMIEELVKACGKPKWQVTKLAPDNLRENITHMKSEEIKKALSITSKQERNLALKKVKDSIMDFFKVGAENSEYTKLQIDIIFDDIKSDIARSAILKGNKRIDNRKPHEIRSISGETSILPKTHGSALFTRGETQTLVVATLGTAQDEQIVDGLEGEYKEHFMLNYIFLPYCVGEVGALRAPGRRETGHGRLAWRAMNPVLPSKQEFPYSIRVVSEVTSCNGSSSMATICGASMALMDAGVPIKSAIAGIAMGLVKTDDKFVILSDIIGDEDALGDMDFKVAGGLDGITALQMDSKIQGITFEIMHEALKQAKEGRVHILSEMQKAIAASSPEISKHAPAIKSFKIDKDKIREVIGAGGKVIREICETTGAKIDITDDGMVSVSAVGSDKMEAAISKIQSIIYTPEVGDIFDGTVVRVLESGAFINYVPNRDGFVHISEISHDRIESVKSALSEGQTVKVKIVGFDNKGKAKLTIKNLDKEVVAQERKPNEQSSYERPAKKWQNPDQNSNRNGDKPVGNSKERKYFN